MELYLHLGAHRTGTTALQQSLQRGRRALRAAGVTFWGPRVMRQGSRRDFVPRVARSGGGGAGRADLAPVIADLATAFEAERSAGARRLLVSDENLLGAMNEVYSDASLYWDARDWMAATAELLPVRPTRIFLCVRDYADFAVSIYAHLAMRKRMGVFAGDRLARLGEGRGWPAVLADIRSVFPETRVSVWRYGNRPGTVGGAVAAMVGPEVAEGLGDPPRAAGHSASKYALMEIVRLWQEPGDLTRPDIQARAEKLRSELPGPPLDPFAPDQLSRMRARFEADWTALSHGKVAGVETFDPVSVGEGAE